MGSIRGITRSIALRRARAAQGLAGRWFARRWFAGLCLSAVCGCGSSQLQFAPPAPTAPTAPTLGYRASLYVSVAPMEGNLPGATITATFWPPSAPVDTLAGSVALPAGSELTVNGATLPIRSNEFGSSYGLLGSRPSASGDYAFAIRVGDATLRESISLPLLSILSPTERARVPVGQPLEVRWSPAVPPAEVRWVTVAGCVGNTQASVLDSSHARFEVFAPSVMALPCATVLSLAWSSERALPLAANGKLAGSVEVREELTILP